MMLRRLVIVLMFVFQMVSSALSQGTMSWDWVRTAGGSLTQKATSIAVDQNNDVIIAGTFNSSFISLGSNNIILINNDSMSSPNYFIAKYNQTGEVIWAKKAICYSGVTSHKVITDNIGNIYACGFISTNSINQPVSFDGISSYIHNGGKAFLTKYSPQGVTQWVMFINNRFWGYDTISCIKWDEKSNSIFIGGYCQGDTVNVGGIDIINAGNNLHSSFIAKISTQQGNAIWVKNTKGNSFINKINEITLDTSGAIYTAASFWGNYLVLPSGDTIINTSASSGALIYDGYFAKYDNNGIFQWFKKGLCATNDEVTAITVQNNNRLVIGGYNNSQLIFNGVSLNGSNFILEYDIQGNYHNAENFPATIVSINAYKKGNGFFTGGIFSSDSLILGNTILNRYGNPGSLNSNFFIARSDTFGTYNNAIAAGGIASSMLTSLVISDSNKIYLSGSFNQPSIFFDTNQYISNGLTDLFFAKLDADLLIPIPLNYNLGGTVFAGLFPVDHAIVYLYEPGQNVVDSCLVDTLGFYHFYQKPAGNYKLSAEISSNSVYFNQNYVATFYPDKIIYSDAEIITLNANKWGRDVRLQTSNAIDEIENKDYILSISKIYPNPANNEVYLSVNNLVSSTYSIEIMNSCGQSVYSQTYSYTNPNGFIQLNIRSLKKGLYHILLMDKTGKFTNARFIKS